jgi:hypothetical protein
MVQGMLCVICSPANCRIGVSALWPIAPSRVVRSSSQSAGGAGGLYGNIQITNAGHVVTWQYDGLTLTEVAASAQHPLPQRRRLISHRLKDSCSDDLECRGGITYHVDFSLEPVARETFWHYQKELTQVGAREGLLHCFEPSGRFGLGAMSYINVESRDRSLRVQAFHTFPDDYAIVKSQSVFTLPGKSARA